MDGIFSHFLNYINRRSIQSAVGRQINYCADLLRLSNTCFFIHNADFYWIIFFVDSFYSGY